MLSLTVRTKRTDIGGCKTQTSVIFDHGSVDDAAMETRSVSGTNGFGGTIYHDHVRMSIGYDGNVEVTREQMVAILKDLQADSDWGELAEALDSED